MRFAIASLLLVLSLATASPGAFTDFGDYTHYEEFALEDVFTSKNLSFKVVELVSPNTPVPARIFATSTHSFLIPGPGVEFLLPPNVHEVSLRYGGAGYAISINGEEAMSGPIFQTLLDDLNGTSLGGVSIATTRSIPPPLGDGFLTLSGAISSLVIGGVELTIDDITVRVPEPSTAALLLIGASGMAMRRKAY
jgi:hypothetical protein